MPLSDRVIPRLPVHLTKVPVQLGVASKWLWETGLNSTEFVCEQDDGFPQQANKLGVYLIGLGWFRKETCVSSAGLNGQSVVLNLG